MYQINTKKSIFELPQDVLLLKHHLFDSFFTRKESNYYFSLLYDLDEDSSPKIKKVLFRKGALIKIHTDKNEKPSFYPTPPTFIYFAEEEDFKKQDIKRYSNTINELEKVYYEKHFNPSTSVFQSNLQFISGRGVFFIGFIMFLLKTLIKEQAYITSMNMDQNAYETIKMILGEKFEKTNFIVNSDYKDKVNHKPNIFFIDKNHICNLREIVIDSNFKIDILTIDNAKKAETLYMGYISSYKESISSTLDRLNYLIQRKN